MALRGGRMALRNGGMALRGGHFSTMPVLREWRNGGMAGMLGGQAEKPIDARGECCRSAASSVDGSTVMGAGLSSRSARAGTSSMVRERGLPAGVNTLGRR